MFAKPRNTEKVFAVLFSAFLPQQMEQVKQTSACKNTQVESPAPLSIFRFWLLFATLCHMVSRCFTQKKEGPSQSGAITHAPLACHSVAPSHGLRWIQRLQQRRQFCWAVCRLNKLIMLLDCFKHSLPFKPADQEWSSLMSATQVRRYFTYIYIYNDVYLTTILFLLILFSRCTPGLAPTLLHDSEACHSLGPVQALAAKALPAVATVKRKLVPDVSGLENFLCQSAQSTMSINV